MRDGGARASGVTLSLLRSLAAGDIQAMQLENAARRVRCWRPFNILHPTCPFKIAYVTWHTSVVVSVAISAHTGERVSAGGTFV